MIQNQSTIVVHPKPGYVVKCHKSTQILDNTEEWHQFTGKVFINVCHNAQIPISNTTDETVIASSIKQKNTFKIPMSISKMRKGRDKQGNDCWVVDICVNTVVFEWSVLNKFTSFSCDEFKTFLIDILLAFVLERLQLQLKFISVPNRLVMCPPLPFHEIVQKKQVITIIDCPMSVQEYKKGRNSIYQFHPVAKDFKVFRKGAKIKVETDGISDSYLDVGQDKNVRSVYYENHDILRIYVT